MQYVPALDGLRAVAVFIVIGHHADALGFDGGFIGVDIFFVLSGFLITSLLAGEHDRSGEVDVRRFYLRRFLRLTPALLLMLAAYLAVAPILWPEVTAFEHARDAALAAAYLSDYSRAFWGVPDALRHTWSLSVEQHFYLLWPLVLLPILKLPHRSQLALLLALYVLTTIWRQTASLVEADWDQVYCRFDTRLSGLVLGSLAAVALRTTPDLASKVTPRMGYLALAMIASASILVQWGWTIVMVVGMTVVEVASVTLILFALGHPESPLARALSSRPFVATGVLSYGMYLWHYPAALYMRDVYPWYLTFSVALILSVVCAGISYVTVERMARRLQQGRGVLRRRSGEAGLVARSAVQPALALAIPSSSTTP